MIEIDREEAVEVAAAAFEANGISSADAELTASVLVSADARGKHSHGLLRLPLFVRGIEHGNVDPDGAIEVVADRGATAAISGGDRLGPVVAMAAIEEVAERADRFGIGAVGVRETNHLGMLGYYTDELRRNGYVAIAMTNGEPAMPPHGGAEPVLGTNPVAIGLPTDPPFNLDMATSAIARGDILHKRELGEELPEGVALDAAGAPTTDPDEALDGVVLPIAGPKGSGLAIAVEVLAGGLVGASMGRDVTGTYHTEDPCTKGDLFIAIDPTTFGRSEFVDRASAFLRDLLAVERAADAEEVRMPGARSIDRDETADVIEIDSDLWTEIRRLAA